MGNNRDAIERHTEEFIQNLLEAGIFDGTVKIAVTACAINIVREVMKAAAIKPVAPL